MVSRTGRFIVWRSVCLVMIGLISVAEATVPPIPKGIVSMPVAGPNGFPNNRARRLLGMDVLRPTTADVLRCRRPTRTAS